MKRIILHWTGGAHTASNLDKEHYHFIYEGDGNAVRGKWDILDNVSPVKPRNYAAHTLNCNGDSIGLAVACMAGAIEGKTNGNYPMTEMQLDAMCRAAAHFCKLYGIPVTDRTVLTHAEVQNNLGIKQRGKWDIAVIPFRHDLVGAKACGDNIRTRVQAYLMPDFHSAEPEQVTASKFFMADWFRRFFGVKK